LHYPATFPVKRLFESKHPVPDEFSQYGSPHVAPKSMLLNDKDLFYQAGIVNEISVLMKKAEIRERTERSCSVLEKPQRA